MKNFVVFLEYRESVKQDTGETLYICKLADVKVEANGRFTAYIRDLFAVCRINVNALEFGSVVNPVFRDSQYLGGRPELIDLQLVSESPFKLLG